MESPRATPSTFDEFQSRRLRRLWDVARVALGHQASIPVLCVENPERTFVEGAFGHASRCSPASAEGEHFVRRVAIEEIGSKLSLVLLFGGRRIDACVLVLVRSG
eukprot:scaffold35480_cov31-Tisochrysis_lutea.AAC.1